MPCSHEKNQVSAGYQQIVPGGVTILDESRCVQLRELTPVHSPDKSTGATTNTLAHTHVEPDVTSLVDLAAA